MTEDEKQRAEEDVDPSEAYEVVNREAAKRLKKAGEKAMKIVSDTIDTAVEMGKRKGAEIVEKAMVEGVQAATDENYLTKKQEEMIERAKEREKKLRDKIGQVQRQTDGLVNKINSELTNAEKEIEEKGTLEYTKNLLGLIANKGCSKLVELTKKSLAPVAQLRIDGFDSIIGEDRARYGLPDSDITSPHAEAVSYFVTELARDRSALPYNLGAGKGDNSAVRKQILEHMISFATTNAEELLGCLKEIMDYGIESNVAPEMLELEIGALDRYNENILEKEKKLFEG